MGLIDRSDNIPGAVFFLSFRRQGRGLHLRPMKKLLRILQLIFGILFGIVGAFFSLTILGGIWIAHAG